MSIDQVALIPGNAPNDLLVSCPSAHAANVLVRHTAGERTAEPDEPSYTFTDPEDSEETEQSLLDLSIIPPHDLDLAIANSPFIYLPSEIIEYIFSHLDVENLKTAFLVCKLWSLERTNEVVWKKLAFRLYREFAPYKPPGMSWRLLSMAAAGPVHVVSGPEPAEEKPSGLVRFLYGRGDAGEYIGEAKDGLPHGYGIKLFEIGNIFFGQFEEGRKTGYGEFRWKNGNLYRGDWKDDKQNGKGEFKWNDGDYYKGDWKDDHRHGTGMYTWPKGSYYEGEFSMNDLHNFGRYTWKNGYYEGGWKNSTRHGKGIIRWTNGNSFEGQFVNNSKSGYGVYRWSDGATYSGTWHSDDRSGAALTQWANGMSYDGKYDKDLRNGEGVLLWPNGDSYRGTWKNGGRWGAGEFTEAATGGTHAQVWREEEKIQYSKAIPARNP